MLKKYIIKLTSSNKLQNKNQDLGYFLYSCLLSKGDTNFGDTLHLDGYTLINQYVTFSDDYVVWNITLFNDTIKYFDDILKVDSSFFIKRLNSTFKIIEMQATEIITPKELLTSSKTIPNIVTLKFNTPTSFKSAKKYQNMPSLSLIINSLFRKWNNSFEDFTIDDEDGEGLQTIINGLNCVDYNIKSDDFILKGNTIKAFSGYLTIKINLTGFHLELAKTLLYYSQYSGIGIKTTLGMGGIVVIL